MNEKSLKNTIYITPHLGSSNFHTMYIRYCFQEVMSFIYYNNIALQFDASCFSSRFMKKSLVR